VRVIPALDISHGRAVRIVEGDLRSYGNPYQWLNKFEGAKRIHIIDIDAALDKGNNLDLILEIVKDLTERGIETQVGGGLRDPITIRRVIEAGAFPILGTIAYERPTILRELAKDFPLIVAIDLKERKIMIRGWIKETTIEPEQAVSHFRDIGVKEFLITDIDSDGRLSGYLGGISLPSSFPELMFTYAGGIRDMEDLERLSNDGFSSAVVGRAIYETDLMQKLIERGWEI